MHRLITQKYARTSMRHRLITQKLCAYQHEAPVTQKLCAYRHGTVQKVCAYQHETGRESSAPEADDDQAVIIARFSVGKGRLNYR